MQPIVARLRTLIDEHDWHAAFAAALESVGQQQVPGVSHLRTVDDYLAYIDDLVRWSPREAGDSRLVHDKMVEFYFVLDQPPLRQLQSPAAPTDHGASLAPLAQWIRDFARTWGEYLDTPESASHLETFRTNPAFHWDEYMPPASGYRTFNQFFARHVRPGRRPVASPADAGVVVSPADAVFIGSWRVASDASIYVEDPRVDVKGMQWSMRQLLDGSDYAERFAGGTFLHVALRTYDYHRWHMPVPGRVVEARVVQGQAWLDVEAVTVVRDGAPTRVLRAVEGTGYQFSQTRALVVVESPYGLVACIPVGMGHVSSVVITADVGLTLRKGEELGYFQFGGSDFVMVFERKCQVELSCRVDSHYVQGAAIGRLHR